MKNLALFGFLDSTGGVCTDTTNSMMGVSGGNNKKKIDKSIDFLRGWEEKMVSIFCLGRCEKVEVSPGPNEARSEIHT